MYVTSFFFLQTACVVLVEYVCGNGHRIKHRLETLPYDDPKFVWC